LTFGYDVIILFVKIKSFLLEQVFVKHLRFVPNEPDKNCLTQSKHRLLCLVFYSNGCNLSELLKTHIKAENRKLL